MESKEHGNVDCKYSGRANVENKITTYFEVNICKLITYYQRLTTNEEKFQMVKELERLRAAS